MRPEDDDHCLETEPGGPQPIGLLLERTRIGVVEGLDHGTNSLTVSLRRN